MLKVWSTSGGTNITGSSVYGYFAIVMSGPNLPTEDVTFFRNSPLVVESYSFADPFGDSLATIRFPQITPYDDLESRELWFAREYVNVDIYWVNCRNYKQDENSFRVINTLSSDEMWASYTDKEKLWEGFVISLNPTDDGLVLECQGAIFELDRYLAAPLYPDRPWVNEALIERAFLYVNWNPTSGYKIRLNPLSVIWPEGWSKVLETEEITNMTPRGIPFNYKWTGYSTRNTGSWNRLLTGYIQDLLSTMYTTEDCGVTAGNQWTIRKDGNRQPVLYVRDRFKDPTFVLYYGTPGVDVSLTRDSAGIANVIYGQGVGFDGSTWTNSIISDDGQQTSYDPLVSVPEIYPINTTQDMPMETMVNFGNGVGYDEGIKSARKMLARDRDPGWVGNITIQIDPELWSDPELNYFRWQIWEGMTVLLKGFAGKREGIRLHIAEVVHTPEDGKVSMKVDSKYRDLLTLEEVIARVRDPLTPTKMLQVNRRAQIIEDINAPWDYSSGSGYVPRPSLNFFEGKSDKEPFPWPDWLRNHPPSQYADAYVKIPGGNKTYKSSWAIGVPILMGAAGTIRSSKFVIVNAAGEIVEAGFHVSLYYNYAPSIPHTGSNYSPFENNHFQNLDENNIPLPPGNFSAPDDSLIMGWGNPDQYGGYSPGRSSDGIEPTGLLIDENNWSWNMAQRNQDYDPYHSLTDKSQPVTARLIYGAFWADTEDEVYLIGRLVRMEPGTQ